MNSLQKDKISIIRLVGLVAVMLFGILSTIGSGGGEFYISPCFPFPEDWCTPTEPVDTIPPSAPTDLTTGPLSPSKITLSWNESTDNNYVIGYRIYRDGVYKSYVSSNSTTATDTELEAVTQYCYTVTATDNYGNESTKSNESCATTLEDSEPPSIPTNLTVTYIVTDDGVPTLSLRWSPSTDDGLIEGYKIYRDTAYLASSSTTTYADNDINPLTNYCYSILAYDKSENESPLSDSVCATSSWILSDIKRNENPEYISIDTDSNTFSHISYVRNKLEYDYDIDLYIKRSTLKYVTNKYGYWAFFDIDFFETTDLYKDNHFAYLTTKIDSQDYVHISYVDHTGSGLKYFTNSFGYWAYETIVPYSTILGSDMEIDENDYIHISYSDFGDIKYVTNRTGTWVIETIEEITNSAYYPSIAIDPQGYIHVCYYEYYGYQLGGALKYATNKTGSWDISVVETTEEESYLYPSIAIDSVGNIYIIYSDAPNMTLFELKNVAGTWVKNVINDDIQTGVNSVYIDSLNKIHISYVDYLNNNFFYSNNITGSWQTYAIDSKSYVSSRASIAIDTNNDAHISYSGDLNLRYATTKQP